ncbi:MAG: DMT family transporter [Sneathiella sp.]|nr:DMT family transporter [Sneathiella sp.]
MPKLSQHLYGTLITALGVLILTPDGLLVRLISADAWTLLFWRGLFFGSAVLGFYILRFGSGAFDRFRNIGVMGIQATLLFTLSSVFFVQALHHTSVANTLVLIATAPFFSALLSRVFLKEKIGKSTVIAILISCGGIAFIFKGSLSSDHLNGDFYALCSAFCIASQITTVRRSKLVDMVPTLGFSGILLAVIALFFADSLSVSTSDMGLLVLLGFVVIPIAFGLITIGPRYIPAAEVSLLMLLETFLGPLWVWLALGEEPSFETFIGGSLVLTTLAIHTVYNAKMRSNAAPTTNSV